MKKTVTLVLFIITFIALFGMVAMRVFYPYVSTEDGFTGAEITDQQFEDLMISNDSQYEHITSESKPKNSATTSTPAIAVSPDKENAQPAPATTQQSVIYGTTGVSIQAGTPRGENQLPDVPFD